MSDLFKNIEKCYELSKKYYGALRKDKKTHVSETEIKSKIKDLCLLWFKEIEVNIRTNIDAPILNNYNSCYRKLLELTANKNRRSSYMALLSRINAGYNIDILVPSLTHFSKTEKTDYIREILNSATQEEQEYLVEAIGCTENKFFRAATILGWCAAIHRIHNCVEDYGLTKFNSKSKEMKALTQGRYKPFNKSFEIKTRNELDSTVFDKDILWVLEYMEFIDTNQHERLMICYTMRNNSAHPGKAKITEENLLSFFSDLKTIIFENPRFKSKSTV